MARFTLTRPGEDLFVGGEDVEIIATRAGGEAFTVVSGNVRVDASATAGGDIIYLPGLAVEYSAQQRGSTVFFSRNDGSVTLQIPVGINGNEIVFNGYGGTAPDARVLAIDTADARIELGGVPITVTTAPLLPAREPGIVQFLSTDPDTLTGGAGDDGFYALNDELGPGDLLSGLDGIDTLFHRLDPAHGRLAFSGMQLQGVERLVISELTEEGLSGPLSYDFSGSDAAFDLQTIELRQGTASTSFLNVPTLASLAVEWFGRLGGAPLELRYANTVLAGSETSVDFRIVTSFISDLTISGMSDGPDAAIETINFIIGDGFASIEAFQTNASSVNILGEFSQSSLSIFAPLSSSVLLVENRGLGAARIDLSNAVAGVDMTGGVGVDDFVGSAFDDLIITGDGGDSVADGDGDDLVDTGAGDDFVFNGGGSDIVITGDGNDEVSDGEGDDIYDLGDGNDRFFVGGGRNVIDLGAGDDIMYDYLGVAFDAGDQDGLPVDIIDFGSGRDRLELSIETFDAQFKNVVAGSLEEVRVQFFYNPFFVELGAEAQEAGIDTIIVSSTTPGTAFVDASLFTRSLTIFGGEYADIRAGAGDDVIFSRGLSFLSGGAGSDTFRYESIVEGQIDLPSDTITDFQSGVDRLDVRTIGVQAADGKVIQLLGNFEGLAQAAAVLSGSAGNGRADAVFANGPDLLLIDLDDDGIIEIADLRVNLIGVDALVGQDIFAGDVINASPAGASTAQSGMFEEGALIQAGVAVLAYSAADLAVFQDLHVR
jgi:Ca2+-binding RTX toxin-like protein